MVQFKYKQKGESIGLPKFIEMNPCKSIFYELEVFVNPFLLSIQKGEMAEWLLLKTLKDHLITSHQEVIILGKNTGKPQKGDLFQCARVVLALGWLK